MGYCKKHDAYNGNGHCKWCDTPIEDVGIEERLARAEKDRDRLLVLAMKHCPKQHHDWTELCEIYDRIHENDAPF